MASSQSFPLYSPFHLMNIDLQAYASSNIQQVAIAILFNRVVMQIVTGFPALAKIYLLQGPQPRAAPSFGSAHSGGYMSNGKKQTKATIMVIFPVYFVQSKVLFFIHLRLQSEIQLVVSQLCHWSSGNSRIIRTQKCWQMRTKGYRVYPQDPHVVHISCHEKFEDFTNLDLLNLPTAWFKMHLRVLFCGLRLYILENGCRLWSVFSDPK